jgi:hypothetical protein
MLSQMQEEVRRKHTTYAYGHLYFYSFFSSAILQSSHSREHEHQPLPDSAFITNNRPVGRPVPPTTLTSTRKRKHAPAASKKNVPAASKKNAPAAANKKVPAAVKKKKA